MCATPDSYTLIGARFVASAEVFFDHPAELPNMLAWLEADLKKASKNRDLSKGGRPWIIAGAHRPIGDIQYAKALFTKYGVDMYFAGHSHLYARSLPVSYHSGNGTANIETHHDLHHYRAARGTTLIVAGGAGCDEMKAGQQEVLSAGEIGPDIDNGYLAPKGSLVTHTKKYASGVLTVNASALNWQLIDSATGAVLDTLVLTKK